MTYGNRQKELFYEFDFVIIILKLYIEETITTRRKPYNILLDCEK